MKAKFTGILPAIMTPFTRGGAKVDYEKACAFASVLADRGASGLFVCGSTGEGLLLTLDERKQLAEEIVGAVAKRIKVVVQTGCLDTASTIELSRHARDAGAHAIAVYTPAFYKYDDRALFSHFQSIAKSAPEIPMFLYNIPKYTGNALSPALIQELAEKVDSIIGTKDSSGDMVHLSRVLAMAPKGFNTLNGADELNYQAYLSGVEGSVSITANIVPELFQKILSGVKSGKLDAALKAQRRLAQVMAALGYGQTLSAYKEAIRLQGYDVGYVRPPQRELNAAEKRAIAKNMSGLGLI